MMCAECVTHLEVSGAHTHTLEMEKSNSVSPCDEERNERNSQKYDSEKTENETFEELGLGPELVKACTQLHWKNPTAVQKEAIPHAVKGRDIIGLAETGSGKTAAFALPMLHALLANPSFYFSLVLAPTRELCFQIGEQIEAIGSGIGVKVVIVVGGVDFMEQAVALSRKPHVIVATPGRMVDHLENTKGFNLKNLKYLVLDEADRLLGMDFEKELLTILENIPRQRQTMLFSATMTSKVEKLQKAALQNPVKVEVSNKYTTVKGLIQQYLFIPAKYKETHLVYILNELCGLTSIVFCSTCETTKKIALMLKNLGFETASLHGKLNQSQRLANLARFKAGTDNKGCNILICTDVASRGLDIPSVDLVINYDIPTHSKDYVHRVGRTARAGRSGRAITFVSQYDVELFQRIEKLLNKRMDLFPTEQDAVMVLFERTSEAARLAALQLREEDADRKDKRKSNRTRDANADDRKDSEAALDGMNFGINKKRVSKFKANKLGKRKHTAS